MTDLSPTKSSLLGTGRMGAALAMAMLEAGHDLTVWNRSPERVQPLLASGAGWAEDPATAVRDADTVTVCLVDVASTYEVLGDASVRRHLRGKTLVQIATGSPEDAQDLAVWAEATGATLLVAFVKAYPSEIGSELTEVHFAGSAEAFERHRPTFACWGRTQFVGSDVRAATARNTAGVLMMFSLMAGFAEAAGYARTHGVAPSDVEELLGVSFRVASAAIRRAVQAEAGDSRADPEATLDVYVSALRSVVRSINESGLQSRLGEASLALFTQAVRAGLGDRDIEVLLAPPPDV